MTRKTFFGEEVTRTEVCYRADGLFLWNYGDGNYMLRTPDCFVERYPEEEYEYIYGTTIFDSAEDRAALFESVQAEDFLSMLEEETLEKTYITDDGLFIAETRCSNPVIVRTHLGETEYTGSYVYADGMSLTLLSPTLKAKPIFTSRKPMNTASNHTIPPRTASFSRIILPGCRCRRICEPSGLSTIRIQIMKKTLKPFFR